MSNNHFFVSNKHSKSLIGMFVFFSSLIGLGVGLFVGINVRDFSENKPLTQQTRSNNLNLLQYAEGYVQQNFLGEFVDLSTVEHKLLKSYIEALGDENSYYLLPEEAEQYLKSFSQDFEGIGVILVESEDKGSIIISSLIEGGAAFRANEIKVGSKILLVNETEVAGFTIQEVASLIRGPSGTIVKIDLQAVGGDRYSVSIVREKINVPKITITNLGDSTSYVRIIDFIDESITKYNSYWDSIESQVLANSSSRIILDLRSNTGGYVEAAIHIAKSFLDRDAIIMTEINAQGITTRTVRAQTDGSLRELKVAIIIDGNSASASEILALALKENHPNTTIVGQKSFGKGTEQKMIQNFGGSGGLVNLTFQKWTSPTGQVVTKTSPIIPDIFVDNISSLSVDEVIQAIKKAFDN